MGQLMRLRISWWLPIFFPPGEHHRSPVTVPYVLISDAGPVLQFA